MDKKSILITGAGNGIGRCVAQKFIKEGFYAFGLDIDEAGLKAVKQEFGDSFDYHVTDVTSEAAVAEALKQFGAKTGGTMNVLCSNAGILVQKPFSEGALAGYRKMIEINDFGMVNIAYQSLPLLRAGEKKFGQTSIVFTSSASAEFGMPLVAVYSATKGFIRNLTEALAVELRYENIRVADVMPSWVKTAMTSTEIVEEKFHEASVLTPETIAATIFEASSGTERHYLVGEDIEQFAAAHKKMTTLETENLIDQLLGVKDTLKK